MFFLAALYLVPPTLGNYMFYVTVMPKPKKCIEYDQDSEFLMSRIDRVT